MVGVTREQVKAALERAPDAALSAYLDRVVPDSDLATWDINSDDQDAIKRYLTVMFKLWEYTLDTHLEARTGTAVPVTQHLQQQQQAVEPERVVRVIGLNGVIKARAMPSTCTLNDVMELTKSKWKLYRVAKFDLYWPEDVKKANLKDSKTRVPLEGKELNEVKWQQGLCKLGATVSITVQAKLLAKPFSAYTDLNRHDLHELAVNILKVRSTNSGYPKRQDSLFPELPVDLEEEVKWGPGASPIKTKLGDLLLMVATLLLLQQDVSDTAQQPEMAHRGAAEMIMVVAMALARSKLPEKQCMELYLTQEHLLVGQMGYGKVDYLVLYQTLAIVLTELKRQGLAAAYGQVYMQLAAVRDAYRQSLTRVKAKRAGQSVSSLPAQLQAALATLLPEAAADSLLPEAQSLLPPTDAAPLLPSALAATGAAAAPLQTTETTDQTDATAPAGEPHVGSSRAAAASATALGKRKREEAVMGLKTFAVACTKTEWVIVMHDPIAGALYSSGIAMIPVDTTSTPSDLVKGLKRLTCTLAQLILRQVAELNSILLTVPELREAEEPVPADEVEDALKDAAEEKKTSAASEDLEDDVET